MVYLNYLLSELRRRRGRTLLTALGLAVGVGLVIAVGALSAGLDRAQQQVLAPLTGVGTDMSVTRPIALSGGASRSGPHLSQGERSQLEQENGESRFGFGSLKPGQKFTRTSFRGTQLSFPAAEVGRIAALDGVASAAGGLTLALTTVSGTVPAQPAQPQEGNDGGGGQHGPGGLNFTSLNVSGVDPTKPELAAVAPSELTKGAYFSAGPTREAILDVSYARSKKLTVGSTVPLAGGTYTVVGVAKTPLGGARADVYVKLADLQRMSARVGRVNTVYVRAASASAVDGVAKRIRTTFAGASVTTAKTLAAQVTGSLADAKSLTSRLGIVLQIVGLLGAVLIASLLTLSSVTKRVRELGTLKALGWPKRLVVRQVAGEALVQGLAGGLLGVLLGLAGAAAISAFAPALKATIASAAQTVGEGDGFGPFGEGAANAAVSQTVSLTAQVSLGLIVVAVLLAVLGGLVAGAVGGLRAARLRPADALRHID